MAITLAEPMAIELVKQGKTVQPPVAGLGLIDTGASTTCVDEEAAPQLKLPFIDVVTHLRPVLDEVREDIRAGRLQDLP